MYMLCLHAGNAPLHVLLCCVTYPWHPPIVLLGEFCSIYAILQRFPQVLHNSMCLPIVQPLPCACLLLGYFSAHHSLPISLPRILAIALLPPVSAADDCL